MATANKRINQFITDTNLTGSELVLMMDNGVTKNMVLTSVKDFILDGASSLPELGFITAPLVINQDITLPDNSIVYYYGDLTIASGYTMTIPSGTTLEFIDINKNIFITGNSNNNSVLVGGVNNIVNPLANNSVVIGGIGLSGNSSNTVYVPKLNINKVITGSTINNLGIDSNGNIIISDLFSLSDLGFNIVPKASKVINQNIILPDNADVTYPSPLTMDINNTIIVPIDTTLIIT